MDKLIKKFYKPVAIILLIIILIFTIKNYNGGNTENMNFKSAKYKRMSMKQKAKNEERMKKFKSLPKKKQAELIKRVAKSLPKKKQAELIKRAAKYKRAQANAIVKRNNINKKPDFKNSKFKFIN